MPSRSLPARTAEHTARVWPPAAVPLVAALLFVRGLVGVESASVEGAVGV